MFKFLKSCFTSALDELAISLQQNKESWGHTMLVLQTVTSAKSIYVKMLYVCCNVALKLQYGKWLCQWGFIWSVCFVYHSWILTKHCSGLKQCRLKLLFHCCWFIPHTPGSLLRVLAPIAKEDGSLLHSYMVCCICTAFYSAQCILSSCPVLEVRYARLSWAKWVVYIRVNSSPEKEMANIFFVISAYPWSSYLWASFFLFSLSYHTPLSGILSRWEDVSCYSMADSGFLKMSIDMHALKNNLEGNTMAAINKHYLARQFDRSAGN